MIVEFLRRLLHGFTLRIEVSLIARRGTIAHVSAPLLDKPAADDWLDVDLDELEREIDRAGR
jgi:hypothetical protein